jgi:hypothetical protein
MSDPTQMTNDAPTDDSLAERIWEWYLANGGSPKPTPALRQVHAAYLANQKKADVTDGE